MKSKITIFLLLVSCSLLFAIQGKKKEMKKIRVGYEFYESASSLDPANIINIYQSNLIENLYSRILEYDNEFNLICVLCEKFELKDELVIFEFRDDVFTSSGIRVTANDARKTLSRLVMKNTNTHGNLKILIDLERKDSIKVEGNTLTVRLKKAHYSQFFLPLLASMDFSIIPNLPENENLNYQLDVKNTSGPYYVAKDSSEGRFLLKANTKHPHYSKLMAQEIEIVPVEYGSGVDDFLAGKIDLLDITYYPGLPQYEKLFSQKEKRFSSHKTHAINMFVLFFSYKAVNDYSQKQLFYAAKKISDKYLGFKKYGYGFSNVLEYFQSNGMGHLGKDELGKLEVLRNIEEKVVFDKPIVLGVVKHSYEKIKKAFADHPEITVQSYEEDPCFLPYDKRPDIVVQTIDSSFDEDLSLLNYNFSIGNFGISKKDGDQWLERFIEHDEKKKRMEILRDFQLSFLQKPLVYPIGASPYWAIANDDLVLNFSEFTPGSMWWKVRRR